MFSFTCLIFYNLSVHIIFISSCTICASVVSLLLMSNFKLNVPNTTHPHSSYSHLLFFTLFKLPTFNSKLHPVAPTDTRSLHNNQHPQISKPHTNILRISSLSIHHFHKSQGPFITLFFLRYISP